MPALARSSIAVQHIALSAAAPMPAGAVHDPLLTPARAWFASLGRQPFDFQLTAWREYLAGRSGLIHAPTGMGKTLAACIGPMLEAAAPRSASPANPRRGLTLLWVTPLRALAADTCHALLDASLGIGLDWSVELRTGDTSSALKKKQREHLPRALVTTPESLEVLLSYPDSAGALAAARCVVCDEWHELLGSKRGVLAELALARLRALAPHLRTWGVSATLGNIDAAAEALLGAAQPADAAPTRDTSHNGVIIRGLLPKPLDVKVLIPDDIERFPWAGHLGMRQVDRVIEHIAAARSTLLFTNTRSQAETWFRAILSRRPDWLDSVGVHHGSMERALRRSVEGRIKSGITRCVVCTSSLDLGVDFEPVDQVIQIGSPKGVARLLQRAGRSGHSPGMESRIVCVPTNAMELVEFAAARDAIAALRIEARTPIRLALDVLAQHLVTLAAGGGFDSEAALREARSTHAFAHLTDQQWRWCLDFVTAGGPALAAYPRYARVVSHDARCTIKDPRSAREHRLGIGTILSDESVRVKLGRGPAARDLGSVEEGFLARIPIGSTFFFAGRVLRLREVREMSAYVEATTRRSGIAPTWNGARMPLSSELAAALRDKLAGAARGTFAGPEMQAVEPLLRLQAQWSRIPAQDELLIELARTSEGHHAFVYPIEGRLVHEGLAALVAYRLSRLRPASFVIAANDLGFELVCPDPFDPSPDSWRRLLSTDNLTDDLLGCVNASELARRQFREIARVAGLIVPSYPGERRSARHTQASSELFFDVLSEFDPACMLLDQARREVLDKQLELERLRAALERVAGVRLAVVKTAALTPLAFPLWADSLRSQLTSERWADRVARMLQTLERDAAGSAAPPQSPTPEGLAAMEMDPPPPRPRRGARRALR